jgi:hypothetical protein
MIIRGYLLMAKRGFWTKERTLPGQSAVEGTADAYWMLKLLQPPSASAMVLGALGLGYLGWRLFRDSNPWAGLIAAGVGAFLGAWIGLLLYWLVRLIRALND